MLQPDLRSRKPIYEQIMDNLRDEILSGVLAPDEKLPSVRDLSKQLTVNPNTVQKAYRELERQRYVYTSAGLGTFVEKPEARQPDLNLRKEGMELLKSSIEMLKRSGLEFEEIKSAILDFVKEEEEKR
ncbi:MAG: GntR family transcriptional regulator [Clostridiales bacterium]|nr:GntR family transcriptional regulator [Clostridiales bacterium]MDR2751547.1 GntR family transcriptional regulator [Clostridiales bacterium]